MIQIFCKEISESIAVHGQASPAKVKHSETCRRGFFRSSEDYSQIKDQKLLLTGHSFLHKQLPLE